MWDLAELIRKIKKAFQKMLTEPKYESTSEAQMRFLSKSLGEAIAEYVGTGQGGSGLKDVYTLDDSFIGYFLERLYKVKSDDTVEEVTAIQKPRGLIFGGQVTWVQGLQFSASAALYFMRGISIVAPDTLFTLTASDETLDRIDVVIVNETGEYAILEGVPSATPAAPYIDPVSALQITTILLPAGTVSFSGTYLQNIIYNENVEWDGTSDTQEATVDFESTVDPYLGSVCLLMETINGGDYISFVSDTPVAFSDYDTFSLAIKLLTSWDLNVSIYVELLYDGDQACGLVPLQFNRNYFGYWQVVTFRMSDLRIGAGFTQFDEIQLIVKTVNLVGAIDGLVIDYIKLEKSFSPPPSSTTILLDGDITGAGNVGGPVIQTTLKTVTTAGTFGAATKVPQIVVDKNGRILSVTEKTITGVAGDSAYLYIGYASDDIGTDFSLDYNSPSMLPRKYIAALSTATEIITPLAADFAGLWVKFVGDDGDPGDLTHYTYVAWRDSPGAGFTLTPNISLEFEAILVTHTQLTPPVEADFNGLWRQRLTAFTIPPTEDVILPKTLTGARGIKSKFTANEAQVFGDACFINAVGKMQLGKATEITSSSAVGMCINTSIAANVEGDYLLQGFAQKASWDWDTGGLLYLTIAGTAGNTISQESPFNSTPLVEDNVVQILGVAKSENTIYFNPQLSQVVIKA